MPMNTVVAAETHLCGSPILAAVEKFRHARICLKRTRGSEVLILSIHSGIVSLEDGIVFLYMLVQTESPMTISLVLQVFVECLLCARHFASLCSFGDG